MTTFTAAVDAWARVAIAVTWQLAALALLAWLCERALRLRQARVRYALWWFVLLAPLLVTPGRIALQRRQAMVSVRPPEAAVRMVTRHVTIRPALTPVTAPAVSLVTPAGRVPAPRPALRPADLLGLVWLLGSTALALRLAVGHRRVRRLLAASRPFDTEGAREMLSALAAPAGVKAGVALRVSAAIGSPVLYGWRRPVIVAPEGWVESLTANELRAMLAHEIAHVKRRDFVANTVQRLLEIPLFFHPGAWLASRRIALAREELCDAWALSLGTDAASYARSLAAAAERAQLGFAPVSLGIAESKSTLWRRVEAIMRMGNMRAISRPLLLAVIAVGLLSAAAFAAVQFGAAPPAPNGQAASQSDDIAALRDLEQNLKELALATLMYVQDSDGRFPQTQDMQQIRKLLAPYLGSQRVSIRAVRYVLPPGLRVGAIETPTATPMMIVEDHPKYVVTAYADGHVDDEEKKPSGPNASPEAGKRVVEFSVVHENGEPAAGARLALIGGGGEPVVADGKGFCRVVIERAPSAAAFYIVSADGREDVLPAVYFSGPLATEKVVLRPRGGPADTVQFSGRVVDPAGRPVAGADLWVQGTGDHDVMFLSRELGQTGKDGRFSVTIPRLTAGSPMWGGGWVVPWTCQVMAHKPGYGVGWARADGDAKITGLDIRLHRAASLRGKIVDAEGALLPDVTVTIVEVGAGDSGARASIAWADTAAPPWAEMRTDERGRFSFPDLPAGGTVKLAVSTCFGASHRANEMAPDLGEIRLVEQRGELVVKLRQRPLLEGVLLTPEKKPAAGVEVMLAGYLSDQPNATTDETAVTDQSGHYEFPMSVAGTWTVWVSDTTYFAILLRNRKVDVGEHVTIPTAVLQRSARIRGRVLDARTGAPVSNVSVMCRGTAGAAITDLPTNEGAATSGLDGSYEIGGPPGRITLFLAGPPSGYTWSYSVTEATVEGKRQVRVTEDSEKPSNRVLTVKPGEQVTGVDLFLAPEALVSGLVLGPDGRPWRPKGFERGGYVFGGLDRETVTSTTWPPLGTSVEQDGAFSGRYFYAGVPAVLTVTDEEDGLGGWARVTPELGEPAQVTIRLGPLATVVGRIVLPDGTPAAGAAVGMAGAVAVTADEAGRFSTKRGLVGLPLSVSAYAPRWSPERGADSHPKYRGESKWFEIGPGEKVHDVGDIVLQPWEPRRPQ
jgi:beta-lactamase regulating signal transducer with metallopeptidase domain